MCNCWTVMPRNTREKKTLTWSERLVCRHATLGQHAWLSLHVMAYIMPEIVSSSSSSACAASIIFVQKIPWGEGVLPYMEAWENVQKTSWAEERSSFTYASTREKWVMKMSLCQSMFFCSSWGVCVAWRTDGPTARQIAFEELVITSAAASSPSQVNPVTQAKVKWSKPACSGTIYKVEVCSHLPFTARNGFSTRTMSPFDMFLFANNPKPPYGEVLTSTRGVLVSVLCPWAAFWSAI